jgi:hypothetical protein
LFFTVTERAVETGFCTGCFLTTTFSSSSSSSSSSSEISSERDCSSSELAFDFPALFPGFGDLERGGDLGAFFFVPPLLH